MPATDRDRLRLAEQLLACPDDHACGTITLGWLARFAGVRRSVLLTGGLGSDCLRGLAGHGIREDAVRAFSIDRGAHHDPLSAAAAGERAVRFRPGRGSRSRYPDTPLGPSSSFHAVPLRVGAGPRDPPRAVLVLETGAARALGAEARWAAQLLASKLGPPSRPPLSSTFLTEVSHELRTPLHAIMGFTSLMLDGVGGTVTPENRKRLERIDVNSKQLLAVIGALLD